MLRRLFAALLAAAFCTAFTADAEAVYITTNADVDAYSGSTNPLEDIFRIDDAGGNAYANDITGTGPAIGDEIRTVTAAEITTAQEGFTSAVDLDTDGDGTGDTDIVAFSAVRSTISAFNAQGAPTLDLIEGRLFLAEKAAGFDPADPSTFSSSFATIIAEYVLGPRAPVLAGDVVSTIAGTDGDDAGDGQPDPSLVNNQTPNQGSFLQAQQRAVFLEDSQPGQSPGDGFLTNDDTPFAGLVKVDEGLFLDIATTIQDTDTTSSRFGAVAAAVNADLAGLNEIAAAAAFSSLGAAFLGHTAAFSTADGTGQASEFDPGGSIAAFNGDVFATFTSDAFPVNNMVPEPSSFALLGMGILGMGIYGLRRRRNRKDESVAA